MLGNDSLLLGFFWRVPYLLNNYLSPWPFYWTLGHRDKSRHGIFALKFGPFINNVSEYCRVNAPTSSPQVDGFLINGDQSRTPHWQNGRTEVLLLNSVTFWCLSSALQQKESKLPFIPLAWFFVSRVSNWSWNSCSCTDILILLGFWCLRKTDCSLSLAL